MKTLRDLRSELHEFPHTPEGMTAFEEALRLREIAQNPAFGGEALDDDDPNTQKALREIRDGDVRRLIEYVDSLSGDARLAAVEALGSHEDDDEDSVNLP